MEEGFTVEVQSCEVLGVDGVRGWGRRLKPRVEGFMLQVLGVSASAFRV